MVVIQKSQNRDTEALRRTDKTEQILEDCRSRTNRTDAEHAKAALVILQIHAPRVHVLLTDIRMPGTMDGLALAHHTAKHWPKIVLLITSARQRPERTTLPKKSRFLAKPYQHHHVIRHIRELAVSP
jgi:CheY-like chemotaxis protein